MCAPAEAFKEINEAVLGVGKASLGLLQRFLSGRVSRDDLLAGLSGLRAGEVLSKYWEELTSDARYVPHWKVLQTLNGLVDELEYQLGEYGESTLHDDIKEIAINLKRISEQTS